MKEIERTFIFSKQKLNNYLFSINGTFVNLTCNAFLIKGHLKPGRQQGYNAEVYESLYCSVLSLGGNVNTRRMSQSDMGSIFT